MTACTLPTPPTPHAIDCLLPPAGVMTLRVRGSSREERLIRIHSQKCTVGAAAGCTLRLHAAGIEPLHCWILRGSAGAVVRRLHGQATINGATFVDAPLASGDRLRLGSVELEIVQLTSSEEEAGNSPFPAPAELAEETKVLECRLNAASERIARLEGETRQGFQSSIVAADRADQLRDALAAAHQQLEEACRELAAAQETMTRQTAELDKNRHELSEVEAAEGELAEQLLQARHAAESAASERAAREVEAEEAQTRLTSETQQWQSERTQLERRLQQREAELDAVRSTSTAQTGSMTMVMSAEQNTVDPAQSLALEQAQARVADLEVQLAAHIGELATLRRAVGEQAILQGRLSALQDELASKDAELKAAEASGTTAAEQSRRQGELESRAQSLAQQEADLVERVARALEAKQQLARDRDALDVERQQLLADRTAAQGVADRETELEQQTADLERHIEAANTRLKELDDLRSQLGGERAALDERAHRLGQRQRDLETKEADFEQRWVQFEERREQVEQQSAEIEVQRQALAKQLEQQTAELAARQSEQEQRSATLSAREIELTQHAHRIAEQLAALQTSSQEPASEASGSSDFQPVVEPLLNAEALPIVESSPIVEASPNAEASPNVTVPWQAPEDLVAAADLLPDQSGLASVLPLSPAAPDEPQDAGENVHDSGKVDQLVSRLVQAGLWRGDESAPAALADASHSAADGDSAVPSANESVAGESPVLVSLDEDESIEMYMSRLLKRVRGDTPAAARAADQQPVDSVKEMPSVAGVRLAADTPAESSEYVPRTAAPELPTNLSAMRELANNAARSAIDRHVRKHTGRLAAGRLVSAGLTIAASLVLGYWAWQTHSVQASAGAAIGGCVGAYWLLAALRRLLQAMRLSRPEPGNGPAAPSA